MAVKSSELERRPLLDRIETMGHRSLRAFAPWLLFFSVPAIVIRFIIDPAWLPPQLGVGGALASAIGYYMRWRYRDSKGEPPLDTA